MKRHLPLILLLVLASAFFAGCATKSAEESEANATVPWGKPADFEGAGVGLPQMTESRH